MFIFHKNDLLVSTSFFIRLTSFLFVCIFLLFSFLFFFFFFLYYVSVYVVLFFCCCIIKYTLFLLLPSYYSFIITLYYSVVSYYVPNRINLCQCSSTAVQNNKNNKNNYSPLNIELQQFIPSIIYMYCLFIVQQHIIGKDGRYREECIQNNAVSIYIT